VEAVPLQQGAESAVVTKIHKMRRLSRILMVFSGSISEKAGREKGETGLSGKNGPVPG
jgi:hypothetical protein